MTHPTTSLPQPAGRPGVTVAVLGGVAFAASSVIAFVAAFVISFGNSYCDEAFAGHHLRDARIELALVGICWAAVPSVTAYLARRRGLLYQPWVLLAGLAVVISAVAIAGVDLRFCLF